MSELSEIFDLHDGVEFKAVDGMDEAIVGVGERMGSEPFLVYNKLLVIEILVQRDKMGYEEAMEFFNYNILGSYVGESTPVFITQL
jgi:hypothetical protein